MKKKLLSSLLGLICALTIQAQLSSNPDKFLGNITTTYQVDYGKEKFYELWNQITPENESKWDAIQPQRGQWNWTGVDRAFNYAKQHGFPYKFHTLIWGSQYPQWMNNLSKEEQLKAITSWMNGVKNKYPALPMIDVVNEAIAGHAPAPYKDALGGDGKTGYDWIIKAFEMAHERWPNAILIYNDYNTFQWNTDQFISLVRTLRDAGAPIDAYGCQSHDLTGCDVNTFKNAMTKIQNALKIPMYITEYDIGTEDDQLQLKNFKEQLPLMWEANYCAGVTLWGYIYGKTWTTNGNSGLIKESKDSAGKTIYTDRPAMTWLREYMNSDKAKNAKSPFPGMVKEASVYVKPASLSSIVGEPLPIEVRAKMRTKTIDHIDFYVNSKLYQTLTEAPYTLEYTPTQQGTFTLKAMVVTTDDTKYERLSSVKITPKPESIRFTDLTKIGQRSFVIADEQQGKAFYCPDNQNLGFDSYENAFGNNVVGYEFRLESLANNSDTSIRKYYLLRLYKQDGNAYEIWGSPGYLNSQPADQSCCFILGLNNQNGQDMKNGAVWEIKYVENQGFTLRNIATGKYLQDAAQAKYDEPGYFTFCTHAAITAIEPLVCQRPKPASETVYNLHGRRIDNTTHLRPGIYIKGGKKFVVKSGN